MDTVHVYLVKGAFEILDDPPLDESTKESLRGILRDFREKGRPVILDNPRGEGLFDGLDLPPSVRFAAFVHETKYLGAATLPRPHPHPTPFPAEEWKEDTVSLSFSAGGHVYCKKVLRQTIEGWVYWGLYDFAIADSTASALLTLWKDGTPLVVSLTGKRGNGSKTEKMKIKQLEIRSGKCLKLLLEVVRP